MSNKNYADFYLRLSSKKQEDGMSRETQEAECRKACEQQGLNVRKIYYENKSAMTPYKRAIFNEMVANQMTKNKADYIVCYCLNRLTRNHGDFYAIRTLVDEFDTKIILVKENIVIQKPFKAHEKFLANILIASAEFEIDHMNEIRKKGLFARAKTGTRPCKTPFGYKKYRGRVVIAPKNANFVKNAFKLYATGQFSINSLIEELFELGFMYPQQPNGKIPRATLSSMLKNLYYTGYYTFSGCKEEIKGNYKAIIDRKLYNEVQEVLKTSGYEKVKKHSFLYSNLLTLQETGSIMTGQIKKDKYIYYATRDKNNTWHSINETVVTETVLDYFKEIRLNMVPSEIVQEVLKEELKPLRQEFSNLKRDVSRKYHKKLRLNDFISKNSIDDEEFKSEQLQIIEEEYPDLTSRIRKTEDKIKSVIQKCNEVMKKRLYDFYIKLDSQTQRKILELVANKFELQDKKVKLTFKSAFRKIRKR